MTFDEIAGAMLLTWAAIGIIALAIATAAGYWEGTGAHR